MSPKDEHLGGKGIKNQGERHGVRFLKIVWEREKLIDL